MFDAESYWELLTQICSDFSQLNMYHENRVWLLSSRSQNWYPLLNFLDRDSDVHKSLSFLAKNEMVLYVSHQEVPGDKWSLLNFYVNQLEALPASSLLLKSAHSMHEFH